MDFEQIRACVNKIILGRGVKNSTNLRIKKMLGVIRNSNIYDNMYDLVNDITVYILTPGEHTGVAPISKFDEEKAGLQVFVEYQTLGFLSNKVRKKVDYDLPHINNSELGDDDSDFLTATLSRLPNPEDMLMGKELANYVKERLAEDGMNVLLKEETNEVAGGKLNISRKAYNKKFLKLLMNMRKNYKNNFTGILMKTTTRGR